MMKRSRPGLPVSPGTLFSDEEVFQWKWISCCTLSPWRGGRRRVPWHNALWFSIVFILSTAAVQGQRFAGDGNNANCASINKLPPHASQLESLPFDLGGTRPRCWNATGLQELSTDSSINRIQEARDITLQAECSQDTQLMVRVIHEGNDSGDGSWRQRKQDPKQRLTTRGWEVERQFNFNILISGTWSHNSSLSEPRTAALVVQLCEVGMTERCRPLVPLPSYNGTSSGGGQQATSPFTRRGLQDAANIPAGLLGSQVDYQFITINPGEDGGFFGQLSLKGAPEGTYSLLGSLVLYGTSLQFEGASTIPMGSAKEELVTFLNGLTIYKQEQPASVKDWAVKVVISLSATGGALVLLLLVQFVRLRNSQVFELTQGKFIVAMLFCGLIATSSIVLLEPKNDLYCKLYQPLIILPMHIMFAILVGRMWRIRAIISPLLLLTLEKKEHWTTKFVNIIERITRAEGLRELVKKRDKKLRRAITDGQLMRVIVLLSIPQIIVQIFILAIRDQSHTINHVHDNRRERLFQSFTSYETCKDTFFNNALGIMSFSFLLALFVILMVLAGTSRDLPSLFNETQSMLTVALNAFRMSIAGAILLVATRAYPSAGTSQFLVFSFMSGVTIVNTCFRITWPKFAVARSGSKIIVSKLIAAHNQARLSYSHDAASSLAGRYSTYPSFYAGNSVVTGLNSGATTITSQRPNQEKSATSEPSSTGTLRFLSSGIDGQPSRTSSEGNITSNLASLQEEDGENSCSMKPTESGVSEDVLQDKSGNTREEESSDEVESMDSSVIMVEEDSRDSLSGLRSRATIDYTRHHSTQNYVSNHSLNSNNRASGSYNRNSFASFAWTNSEFSMASRAMERLRISMGPINISPPTDGRSRYTRVLSRRAMFLSQAKRGLSTLDIEGKGPVPLPPPLSTPPPAPGVDKGQVLSWVRNPVNGRKRAHRRNLPWRHSDGDRDNNGGGKKIWDLPFGGAGGGGGRGERGSVVSGTDAPLPAIPLTIEYNPKHAPGKIRVNENEPPPRRLLLRMIDVERMLSKVNDAILTGLCVDPQDWEEIKEACFALGEAFEKEVEFEWQAYPSWDTNFIQDFDDVGNVKIDIGMKMLSEPSFPRNSTAGSTGSQRSGRGLLSKKLSWKPGLIASSADLQSVDGLARPSILQCSTSNMDSSGSVASSPPVIQQASFRQAAPEDLPETDQ